MDELNDDIDIAEMLGSDNEEFQDTIDENLIVSQRKKCKKRSPVWKSYVEVTENNLRYAKCKLCVEK